MMTDIQCSCPSGRPGQICVTRGLEPPVFTLPSGLAAGTRVKTLSVEKGYWTVEEVDHPERRWRVFVILLEVVRGG